MKQKLTVMLTMVALITLTNFSVSAQIVWTDNFTQNQPPTSAQCNRWTNFLDQLTPTNHYFSVKISGTFDNTGITITDPAAATQLANLLFTRTSGSISSNGHLWNVGLCGGISQNCEAPDRTMELTVGGVNCRCDAFNAIRPFTRNENWGGLNGQTCGAPSQTMRLEFGIGVIVTASGPTTFCEGGSVTLTAVADQCDEPYTYLWSNGETTQSITTGQSGNYSVTVTGSNGCTLPHEGVQVTVNPNPTVNAGEDVTTCVDPVQLNAVGINNGDVIPIQTTKLCLFDEPGGAGNCTFSASLCDDGAQGFDNAQFSQSISSIIPIVLGINFKLYYTLCTQSTTFTFKLNGHVIGSFLETAISCTCNPINFGQYPKTVGFDSNQLQQFWNSAGSNTISVEIISPTVAVAVAGIVAEVLHPGEIYSWSPSAGLSNASISNPIASPTISTNYLVTFTNNVSGCSATDEVTVNVVCNEPPLAVCQSLTVSANDNCQGTATATDFNGGSTDPDGDELVYSVSPEGPYPLGTTDVVLTVTDPDGATSNCNTTITVENLAPFINSVTSSDADGLFEIGMPVSLTVIYVDGNGQAAMINWDDGNFETVSNPATAFTVSHTFGSAGVYAAIISVTDACGIIANYTFEYLVAYDPNAGFVTGGGWIDSPPSAYVADATLTGKANFGFVSKYQKGATVPTGNTEFQFKAGNLNFHSTSYQWLVVAGHKAQFKGEGAINGSGNYKFLLTAIDGAKQSTIGPDKFRIKITDSNGNVVYDNQNGVSEDSDAATIIGGGSIVIHNPKSGSSSARTGSNSDAEEEVVDETTFDPSSFSVYPMPFKDHFYVYVPAPIQESLQLQLLDITGKELILKAGKTNTNIEVDSKGLKSGMYLIKILKTNGLVVRKIMKE